VKLLEKTVLTEEQPVIPVLPVKEAGVYVVELFRPRQAGPGADPVGRPLRRRAAEGGLAEVARGVFELTTDARKYKPGETAKVVIQSPFQTGRALVVVESPVGTPTRGATFREARPCSS